MGIGVNGEPRRCSSGESISAYYVFFGFDTLMRDAAAGERDILRRSSPSGNVNA